MARHSPRRRFSRWSRPLRHRMLIAVLEAARKGLVRVPHGAVLALGRAVGNVAWAVLPGSRRLAAEQIEAAGIAAGVDARRLARRNFESLGMTALEWLHSSGWSDAQVRERVAYENGEAAGEVLAAGRGVMAATAHIGNWELMLRAGCLHSGHAIHAVMTPPRDPGLTAWLVRAREAAGAKMVLTDEGALGLLRLLRRGRLLAALIDQDSTRTRGVFLDFFGRPAYTPLGPGLLARLAGAPLVPVCIRRRADDPRRHVMTLGDLIRPDPDVEAEADARRMMQEATAVIEGWIREAPEQWVWVHDRWRRGPPHPVGVRGGGGRKSKPGGREAGGL